MKTVALYSYVPKLHSLYNEIIKYPPEGYTYTVDTSKISSTMKAFYTHKKVKDFAFWKINGMVDTVRVKDRLYSYKKFSKHDLLYSTGYLCLRNEPWVVDMEFPSSFTGYYLDRFIKRRDAIAKILSKSDCKQIIPWTDAAANVMHNAFPEIAIKEKVKTVPLAISPKQVRKIDRHDGKVRLLFVGSSNLPQDFEIKGGQEVFIAYERLIKKFDFLELVFRCYVPPEYKQRYGSLPGVKIVDSIIPWEELEMMYVSADIFVGIAHYTPGVAHLEAMSYGLPIIGTDVWENAKIITRDIGVLIPKHSKAEYFGKYGMPIWGFPKFMQSIKMIDESRVNALVDALTLLIEKRRMRESMGIRARECVESGPHSISARNRLLKNIYDHATK